MTRTVERRSERTTSKGTQVEPIGLSLSVRILVVGISFSHVCPVKIFPGTVDRLVLVVPLDFRIVSIPSMVEGVIKTAGMLGLADPSVGSIHEHSQIFQPLDSSQVVRKVPLII